MQGLANAAAEVAATLSLHPGSCGTAISWEEMLIAPQGREADEN